MDVLREYWVNHEGHPILFVDVDDPLRRMSFHWEQKPTLTNLKILATEETASTLSLDEEGLEILRAIYPGKTELSGLLRDEDFYDRYWMPFATSTDRRSDPRFVDGLDRLPQLLGGGL